MALLGSHGAPGLNPLSFVTLWVTKDRDPVTALQPSPRSRRMSPVTPPRRLPHIPAPSASPPRTCAGRYSRVPSPPMSETYRLPPGPKTPELLNGLAFLVA